MTPEDFKKARADLGLSAAGMARLLRIAEGSTIRKWERGHAVVPGPAAVLIEAILASQAVRDHFGLTIEPK